jgi:hypothetical protein
MCCCFQGFSKHKYLLIILTIIAITLSAVLLMTFKKKEKELHFPIQVNSQIRLLANLQKTNTNLSSQKLKIILQNKFYNSSNIIDELGNIFKIEGPFKLNCDESKDFQIIDKPITWKGQKCCNWPTLPEFVIPFNLSRKIKTSDKGKCGWCIIIKLNHTQCILKSKTHNFYLIMVFVTFLPVVF